MAGEGLAVMRIMRAFPGTELLKWATPVGWSSTAGVQVCVTCGGATVQRNPDGHPDHFRHYQNDGRPVVT